MLHLYKNYLPFFLAIIFSFAVIFSTGESYAQELYKITNKIGGGNETGGQTQDNGNSSTLLIIGAVVIAGFLVYKLVVNKDESVKGEKKDSTSSKSLLINQINEHSNKLSTELNSIQQMPVNFYVGLQNRDQLNPERRLFFGISCNF